jgi:UDP-N-acetylmuramoyl-tripeptide--D-alanyl-D-alanine ligase
VVAVTGSSGKTTVKEMVSAIFEQRHKVLKTKGNFNNLIGLPLSLLPVEPGHDVAVLEMGMNRPGEIARLAEIAEPDVACITNVQGAHLAGLASIEGVARAKGELFAGMKAWGTLVVNADDVRVRKLARPLRHRKVTFGRSANATVRATRIKSLGEEGMSFTLHIGDWSERVRLASLGAHNVMNALAAAAMAHAVGLAPAEIAAGLASHRPYDKRMQISVLPSGLKLINDAYNANPSSMLAALAAVHNLKGGRRIVAVLGDMLELGSHSVAAHRMVGENAASLDFDYLLTVGEFAGELVAGARAGGMSGEQAHAFASKEAIVAWLAQAVQQGVLASGDLILLKGSRGMRMETIAGALSGPEKR